MSTTTTAEFARAAASAARLTEREADVLAEARRVLAELDRRHGRAGADQTDPLLAMYLGRIAEAADAAADAIANVLITAKVYNDDALASYALALNRDSGGDDA